MIKIAENLSVFSLEIRKFDLKFNDMKIRGFALFTSFFIGFSSFIQAQVWTYKQDKNPFDGKYKTCSIIGSGGSFPYTQPVLVLNHFENALDLNLYISEVGYAGCDNKKILVQFDNEDSIYSYSSSTNNDKNVWFFDFSSEMNQSGQQLSMFKLLKKMQIMSTIQIRLESECGQSDYSFSLAGSTTAINFVASEWMENSLKNDLAEKMRRINELIRLDSLLNKRIGNIMTDSINITTFNNFDTSRFEFKVTLKRTQVFKEKEDMGPMEIIDKDLIVIVDKIYFDKIYDRVVYIEKEGIKNGFVRKNYIVKFK
ncbi:MAG: hypothetical protein JNL57_05055 [Bacteroidetes bacterium]|nr:hypothetical protein [Bacteroidota bacterium]